MSINKRVSPEIRRPQGDSLHVSEGSNVVVGYADPLFLVVERNPLPPLLAEVDLGPEAVVPAGHHDVPAGDFRPCVGNVEPLSHFGSKADAGLAGVECKLLRLATAEREHVHIHCILLSHV